MNANCEKGASFDEAAKQMVDWLNKNGHPHMVVVITQTQAELLEGVRASVKGLDFK